MDDQRMTDIDLKPAGRELDALMAERVMGWHRSASGSNEWLDADSMLGASALDFFPSTNISHAWQVVGRLNPYWRLDLTQMGYPPRSWRATLFQHNVSEGVEARGVTAELAICRAALKTREIDA